MKELREVLEGLETLQQRGEEAVLATVVEVCGSTYRRAGARLLISRQGWTAGGISGGCLEGDVLRKAWWRTEATGYALVTYDSTTDEDDEMAWGLGLGCNGVVRVLLERVPAAPSEAFAFLRRSLEARRGGAFATVYESSTGESVGQRFWYDEAGGSLVGVEWRDELQADADAVIRERASRNVVYTLASGETVSVFWEAIVPPVSLILYGTGQDTLPVIRLAKELGWHVTVVAPRSSQNAATLAARFAQADSVRATVAESVDTSGAAVLLMTHQYLDDLALLPTVLRSSAAYVGVLGPRKRADRLLAELARSGETFTERERERLYAPVGLDIGADSPEEIALSIVAEIKAVLSGRGGSALRERSDPIHPRNAGAEAVRLPTGEKITCAIAA
ncbi:MAG: XdhC family protein [Armatimonadetes bacterium]|nr:XdhC family protein [Armatimonadota bacterium]